MGTEIIFNGLGQGVEELNSALVLEEIDIPERLVVEESETKSAEE